MIHLLQEREMRKVRKRFKIASKKFLLVSVGWCMVASLFMTFGPTVNAAVISSRMQTERTKSEIAALLNSELIRKSVKKFGFTEKEAIQIEKAFQDGKFMLVLEKEMGKTVERRVSENERVIDLSQVNLKLVAKKFEESLQKNLTAKLLKKISEKGKVLAGKEATARFILSQLSNKDVNIKELYVELHKTLTEEKLITLGMNKEDARQVVAQMSKADMHKLASGVKVGFAAGEKTTKIHFSKARWLGLAVVSVLLVVVFIGGGLAGTGIWNILGPITICVLGLWWLAPLGRGKVNAE